MRGHIRERSPGHWSIILDVESGAGKRRQRWHTFVGTKRQAQIECSRLITALKDGTYVDPNKITMSEFLSRWLADIKSKVAPRTYERYTEIVGKNLVPAIGPVILAKLKPVQISAVYTNALSGGRRDGKGGLSAATVVYMHRVLRHALADAVRWELLPRNPADAVDPPKVERATLNTYDIAQTAELLDTVRGTRMLIPVALGVLCGLRRGEIAGLRWRHVDFAAAQLAIIETAEQTKAGVRYKPPKSGRGRTVALSGGMVEELRLHRVRQAEELFKLGIRQSESTFVCAREDGEPLQPRTLTQNWRRIAANGLLPRVRFHDLRHAHATHMLVSGVHPKVPSERLGHSKVGITLDLYSHVLPGMQEDAAARVDAALGRALQERARNKFVCK